MVMSLTARFFFENYKSYKGNTLKENLKTSSYIEIKMQVKQKARNNK